MIGLIVLPVPQLPTNWVETFVAVRWPCSLPHERINKMPPGAVGELHAAPAANATRPSNPRVFMRTLLPLLGRNAGIVPELSVRVSAAGEAVGRERGAAAGGAVTRRGNVALLVC